MKRSQLLYDKEISRKSSLISLFEPKKTRTRKLLIKENNNSNRPNSMFSSMQQTKRCDKCKCSLIKMPYEKRKNIIKTNPFSTRSKKLKNNNNNKPNKTLSETSKDKAIFKRKIFIQPSKKKISQKINIRIQNFYNNYTPIIHIVEKKAKSKEKLRDFKYILKRNYSTDKKLNRTIIDNQKNISGALKGRINYYSYNNSIWDSKKKYISSLIEVSTSQKSNDYGFNKIFYTNNLNKDRKLVHSSDKDKNINKFNIKNTNIKINNKNYNKLNASEIIKRNINLEKQNIVELKKEDNKNKKKKIKADKFIKLVNNYINITSNKSESNKQINKLINLLSLTEDRAKIKMESNRKKISDSNKKIVNKKIQSKLLYNISKTNIKANTMNYSINKTANTRPKVIIPANIKKLKMIQKYEKKESKLNLMKGFDSENYNILNVLGEGTFSQIFLVENNITHEKFALKKMTETKLDKLEEKKHECELIMKLTKEDEQF